MTLRDMISNIITKQAAMKTEGGIKFPAEDFAYTPDAEKASTWKLRMTEARPGNITRAQLGRAAAAFSPGGFRGKQVQIPTTDMAKVKAKIRAAYRKIGVEDADIPAVLKEQSSFLVYKEADDTYRWLAVYSNNYRDDDGRPEILSKEAHLDFVRAVDAGEWAYPELWAWHVPGSRWGVADLVAYDEDSGFALSTGTVDKGMEHVAEAMAARDDLLVSHGMPIPEIRRDQKDESVLIRYRTKEISPLPRNKAANKHTEFVALSKEKDMTIKQDKRDFLTSVGFDPDVIEAALAAKKQQVENEGRESKETKDETPDEQAPEPQPTFTADVIAQAMQGAVTLAMEPVLARLAELEQKAKAADDPDPFEAIMTSFKSRVIGSEDARVDGRTKEAKDAPLETAPDGFAPHVKVNSDSLVANSVNRIFGGQTAKELVALQ